jgi:hypothetical protein
MNTVYPGERGVLASVDELWDFARDWQWGEKAAYKRSDVMLSADSSDEVGVDTWLWVNRLNYHLVKQLDAYAEYRMLSVSLGPDLRMGALLGVSLQMGDHSQLGVGYNFTDFNDDLTQQNYKAHGPFVSASGYW